jgi:thiosulfate dehydrogenase [quinone] large subunit
MNQTYIEESPVSKFIFGNTKMALFWLVVRLYVGWQWLHAGWGKLTSEVWVGEKAGTAISGFLKGALTKTGGEHPDVQGWYATFLENVVLPNASLWSHMVAWGEFLVGIALLIGLFTGIAAFFGLFMNMNFLFAGTVSINPLLSVLSIGLVLAWRVAGYWGVDKYLLPLLGTPWKPGNLFRKR